MADAATAFGTGLFRGLTASVSKWEAKRDRERRLRIMQRAATALQEYQRTGKSIDPQLFAEARAAGVPLPDEALRGFDPSTLKEEQRLVIPGTTVDTTVPVDTPGSQAFEAGVPFPEAFKTEQKRRADAAMAQRQGELIQEASNIVGIYGTIPPGMHTPQTAIQYYGAQLKLGNKSGANQYATARWKTNPANPFSGGRSPSEIELIKASPRWAEIVKRVGSGEIQNIEDFEDPLDREAVITVFKNEKNRNAFLSSGSSSLDIMDDGAAKIATERREILGWFHPMIQAEKLRQYITGDYTGMRADELKHLQETTDPVTGQIYTDVLLKKGFAAREAARDAANEAKLPQATHAHIEAFVIARLNEIRNAQAQQREPGPVDWDAVERKLRAAGQLISIQRFQTIAEQAVADSIAAGGGR